MSHPSSIDRQLRLAGIVAFGAMAAMRACDPMLLSLSREFGRTVGDTSHAISAFAIAYGMLQLLYGPLGDHFGKLLVVAFAAAACAVTCCLAAMAPTLDLLVGGRILMGAAAAGVIPSTMAWIADNVPYESRQEALARLLTSTVSGMIAGQWLGAWLTDQFSWRVVFWVLAAIFGLAALPLLKATRTRVTPFSAIDRYEMIAAMPARLSNPLTLLKERRVRWVTTVTALEGAFVFGPLAFVPSHLVNHFGLSTSRAGAVLALYGVGGLVYSQFACRWVGSIGERGLAFCGGVVLGSSLLLLAWANQWGFALPAGLMSGLGFYMLHSTLQMQASQMAPARRGASMSLFSCALFLGQSLGVVATAFVVDSGFIQLAISTAAAALIALAALISRGIAPSPTHVFENQ